MFEKVENRQLAACKRDDKVSYCNPVVGKLGKDVCYAYLAIGPSSEKLMLLRPGYKPQTVYEAEYIASPVITEHGLLFSVYENPSVWRLARAQIDQDNGVHVGFLDNSRGKRDFIQVDSTGTYAVYEKRDGVHTRICLVECREGEWQQEREITDGSYNCYDPCIARQGDRIYVAFTAFTDGNYHIYVMTLDESLNVRDAARRVSDQRGICQWPSVYPREEGGIWICWSSFTRDVEYEHTYLQHEKYAARRRFFTNYAEVYAGVFQDGKLYFNQEEGKTRGYIEPLKVDHAITSKYPKILEIDGEVYLFLRNYMGEEKMFASASVSVMTLTAKGWTEPEVLIRKGLYEESPSILVDGSQIVFAACEDRRKEGWNVEAECFDTEHEIALLAQTIRPKEHPGRLRELCEHFISIAGLFSMEESPYDQLPREDGRMLIWGQTHCHTNLSLCQRMNDQNFDSNFRFFQDVQKSLFGAVSDHDYNMWNLEKHMMHKKADYYYFPGKFIACPAYEWTGSVSATKKWGGPFGHLNPVYLEEDGELDVWVAVDPESPGNTPEKMWEKYAGKKIVTIPHHTADKNHFYTWDHYDPVFVPIVEIFQDCRGEHEQPGVLGSTAYWKMDFQEDYWVLSALKRGHKLGFIGGGDHSGTARGGAEVKALTREALYEAFLERRCYASSGAGADITFTANGKPMGSTIEDEECTFALSVRTNNPIAVMVLVKNGDTVQRFHNLSQVFHYDFTVRKEEKQNFYFVRFATQNGEVFWTSPIWH